MRGAINLSFRWHHSAVYVTLISYGLQLGGIGKEIAFKLLISPALSSHAKMSRSSFM
jgi:hypothetical protein